MKSPDNIANHLMHFTTQVQPAKQETPQSHSASSWLVRGDMLIKSVATNHHQVRAASSCCHQTEGISTPVKHNTKIIGF